MKRRKGIVPFLFFFSILFLSKSIAEPAQHNQSDKDKDRSEMEVLIQKAANDPDRFLEKLFVKMASSRTPETAMGLMALQTNADHLFSKYANEEVLKWLIQEPEKRDSEPTLAPMLIRYCGAIPKDRFTKMSVNYDVTNSRRRTTILMAGLVLGDPQAVELLHNYIYSPDPKEVSYAQSLLISTAHSLSPKIPLHLFQEALTISAKRQPVEAYLKQLFMVEPPDIEERLNQVLSEFPKTGQRLNYIIGVNAVLASPSLPFILCKTLQSNHEAFLHWAKQNGYSSYDYRIAEVLSHANKPDLYYDVLIKNIKVDEKYRKSLLLVGTGLDHPGFDSFVHFPENGTQFRHARLSEQVDFLYTLRCGTRETKQKFLDALVNDSSFSIGKAFLKASLAETEEEARSEIQKCQESIERDTPARRDPRDDKDLAFRLCLSHLQRERFINMKWDAFQQLTRDINEAKSRYLLTKDLRGKIPYRIIVDKIQENMKSEKHKSVYLPDLYLLSDKDLQEHRRDLERLIGHYGRQAEILSSRLRLLGDEDYLYFYFAEFD